MADYPLAAQTIKNEFRRAGIRFVVALPDRVTSHHLLKGLIADPEFKVVQVCKEDEGISICSGLYAAGQKSVFMMQYTGFLDSINAIRVRMIQLDRIRLNPVVLAPALADHLEIIDALLERDRAKAVLAMETHIHNARLRAVTF